MLARPKAGHCSHKLQTAGASQRLRSCAAVLILFSPLTFGVCVLVSFCCMSARKIEAGGSLQQVTVEARQTRLSLSPDSVIISKHGIEFRSATAFSAWTEMTMTLQSSRGGEGKVNCNGVVISCTGNRHTGYHVSMVFTNLSKQAQARLNLLAFTELNG